MSLTTEKAYEILNLPLGASKDDIEQNYKKLAVKWHPEKFTNKKNAKDSLYKFEAISLAYRKLIHNERDSNQISVHEMFEQYRQVFHKKSKLPDNSKNNLTDNTNNETNNPHKNNKKCQRLSELNNINLSNIKSNQADISELSKSSRSDKILNETTTNKTDAENNENRVNDESSNVALQNLKSAFKNLAVKGNELAKQQEYAKAIEKFSEAIKLNIKDYRLYGNRSYCFDKLEQFQESLDDAEKAISLEPEWPKGYFRKGRALFGLKMYKEAEEAYEKVLEFDTNDPELEEELQKSRVMQLQEMGFSKAQSEIAIRNFATVAEALLSMCSCFKDRSAESCSDMDNNELDYIENEDSEDENSFKKKMSNYSLNLKYEQIENRSNQQTVNSTSLWIGNVDPCVTERTLTEIFSAYGDLNNVRCLPEKYCAFVNFKSREEANKAMDALQGKNLEGQRLLIKYPDNPNTAVLSSLSNKTKINTDKIVKKVEKLVSDSSLMKLSGPVNGNECYFWRTTGCVYADKCRYEHIKKNKGIDKKPWHK